MTAVVALARADGGRASSEPLPERAPRAEVVGVAVGPLRFRLSHGPDGPWLVDEAAGRCGGVFVSAAAALKFMREEAEMIVAPGPRVAAPPAAPAPAAADRPGAPVHHLAVPPLPSPRRFGY